MGLYTLRRLFLSIPVLLGIMIVTFAIARLIPGDPCTSTLGEHATVEACEKFDKRMGLDQPIAVQLGIYLKDVMRGDFGDSIRFSRPVFQILIERLPQTIELGIAGLVLAVIFGVPIGVISAVNRNSPIDVSLMVFANMGVSMPVYWLGLMLQYLFALLLKDTAFWLAPTGRLTAGLFSVPFTEVWSMTLQEGSGLTKLYEFLSNFVIFNAFITGNWEVFWDASKHLLLPAVALSTIPMAIIARITRSSMLEVLGQDYIRTAKAKGLTKFRVVTKHAFRNALLPVVTILGLQAGTLFSGAVLTETIFGLAGVGRSLFDAINGRDFTIIQGFTVVVAIGYVMVNLLVDVSYGILDPRIKLE